MAAMLTSHPSRAVLSFAVAVLIAAFGLRLWDLGGPSVWHDEAWSIRAIRDPIDTPDDNTPPVYYSLMHLLYLGAGDSAFALRYGSLLIDLVTVALAIYLARAWSGREAAILAGILFAASPLLWAYAREIRAYVLVPLLTLALLGLADRLLRRRDGIAWRTGAALLAVEIALLYTHNLSVPVVAWLNLALIMVWASRQQWRTLTVWLASQVVALVIYLPWVLGQSPSGTPLNTPPRLSVNLAWDIWRAYFAPVPALVGAKLELDIVSALFGLVALTAGVALLIRRRTRRNLLILSQGLLLPPMATIELWLAHIDFHPRYYLAGVPAALLTVALGLDSLPDDFGLRRSALVGGVAVATAAAAASLTTLLSQPRYQHDDFRAIATYYAGLPPDALIVIPYGWEPALEEYYIDRLGVQAAVVGVPLHSPAREAIERINTALAERPVPAHVELLTWYQLPADERGMFPCLLSAAGRPTGHALTVQGLTTTSYQIERPLALETFESEADFGLLRLEGAAAASARSVCLSTSWMLPTPAASDWRVAARLVTTRPPGWTIARSDTDIRRDDQVPTSAWDAGERGQAFSLLPFPAGAPPGDYVLQLTVYSRSAPNGLDRLQDGVPSGRTVSLITVSPAGTTDEVPVDVATAPELERGVRLAGTDAVDAPISPGQELRITLQWAASPDCCPDGPWHGGTLVLRGEGWEQARPVNAYPRYSLDWHAFSIPADASGQAWLWLEPGASEPIHLATYTLLKTDRLFAPPPFEQPVGALFEGVGTLEGFTLEQQTVRAGEPLPLVLVWRAAETPPGALTVFTHLLDDSGRYIGGHDSPPAGGNRPTTSWVAGEYIVDEHALTLEDTAYRGRARIEVGLYDPDTGQRVLLSGGADHLVLPGEIMVR